MQGKVNSVMEENMTDTNLWDFGFTAVTENELQTVKDAKKIAAASTASIEELQAKLDRLYSAITPLLTNLKQNPELDYLHWPGDIRLKTVEEFEKRLLTIYKG